MHFKNCLYVKKNRKVQKYVMHVKIWQNKTVF